MTRDSTVACMSRLGWLAAITALIGCSMGMCRPAAAITMRRLAFSEVVAAADRAFVGHVVSQHSGRDEAGRPCTWVTFAVRQSLFGAAGERITIKQFGVLGPLADGTAVHWAGMPAYKPGQELVIFLSPDSEAGFSSPVGLTQGTYAVQTRDGRSIVRVAPDNAPLPATSRFQREAAQPGLPVEFDLQQFVDTARDVKAAAPK